MGTIVTAICVHVLAGVFWAGSTMTLALVGHGGRGIHAAQLFSGALVVGAGTYLWYVLHAGNFSETERMLAIGAVAALVALVLQCLIFIPELLGTGSTAGRSVFGIGSLSFQRIAALLLAVAALAMAASKYI